ncbi:MAG TPA: HD domain-containing protein [Bacteroidales bacterium]|nr:HD domain-containing protein [Bacteroidales bacterium]
MPHRIKIINDPVHGFVTIPGEIQFRLIEHQWFQRLRRIKQLGLTYLVYPAALHARFQHSLGAMHLMVRTLNYLISKGHDISPQEREDAINAILLHDIGHGPFSHTLENTIVTGLDHEQLGRAIIRQIDKEFDGALQGAMAILEGRYHRQFLCQLVSGQMDMDRMDYLRRDSFYTGVAEGFINVDRLLAMLDIAEDELVIEAKGVFTIEHFLAARRMMYWQVYLHKTVLAAEFMLSNALLRARHLVKEGRQPEASSSLRYFLENKPNPVDLEGDAAGLRQFTNLDDVDIFAALKQWQYDNDVVLSLLASGIVNRKLFRIELLDEPPAEEMLQTLLHGIAGYLNIDEEKAGWLLIKGQTSNQVYNPDHAPIRVLQKNGALTGLHELLPAIGQAGQLVTVTKHFVCYPKFIKR